MGRAATTGAIGGSLNCRPSISRGECEREEEMLGFLLIRSGLAALLLILAAGVVAAQDYRARLSGFFEIGSLTTPTGAILTDGTGTLHLDVDKNSATYSLTYSGLSTNVTQAH